MQVYFCAILNMYKIYKNRGDFLCILTARFHRKQPIPTPHSPYAIFSLENETLYKIIKSHNYSALAHNTATQSPDKSEPQPRPLY